MERPPRLAAWLLARLMTGPNADGLIGDLLESHARRQSAIWFWWQTFGAIVAGVVSDLRARCGLLLPVAFLAGFGAAAILGTFKTVPEFAVFDAIFVGLGAGWLVCRFGGPSAAFLFAMFVLVLGVPPTSEASMSVLDHFRGLWLLAHYGTEALPPSMVLAQISIVAGAVAGARHQPQAVVQP